MEAKSSSVMVVVEANSSSVRVVVAVMMVVAVVLMVELECAGECVGGGEQQDFTAGAQRAACNSFRRPTLRRYMQPG